MADACGRVSFSRLHAVPGRDDRLDPAPDVEIPDHLHPGRIRARHQVLDDPVDRSLVEDSVVPEGPEIELEALELNADSGRDVGDPDDPEVGGTTLELLQLGSIGLNSAEGTERGELAAVHVNLVRAVGIGILECLEQLWSRHPGRMYPRLTLTNPRQAPPPLPARPLAKPRRWRITCKCRIPKRDCQVVALCGGPAAARTAQRYRPPAQPGGSFF